MMMSKWCRHLPTLVIIYVEPLWGRASSTSVTPIYLIRGGPKHPESGPFDKRLRRVNYAKTLGPSYSTSGLFPVHFRFISSSLGPH